MPQPINKLSLCGSISLSSNLICFLVKGHLTSTNTVWSLFSVVSSCGRVSQSIPYNKASSYEWITKSINQDFLKRHYPFQSIKRYMSIYALENNWKTLSYHIRNACNSPTQLLDPSIRFIFKNTGWRVTVSLHNRSY